MSQHNTTDKSPAYSAQMLKDVAEHVIRLQQQVNDLTEAFKKLDTESNLDTFESRVWETVLTSTISNMMNPSFISSSDPKARQTMIARALHKCDEYVEAVALYRQEKLQRKKDAQIDPIKSILSDDTPPSNTNDKIVAKNKPGRLPQE